MVIASGNPVESSNIQLYLALPTGEVIIARQFNAVDTLEHNGTYSCIAILNGVPTVATLPVIVFGKEMWYVAIKFINLATIHIFTALST